ncbi:hypothetical protein ACWDAO_36625 [Streptomyces sp. NPDC001212]
MQLIVRGVNEPCLKQSCDLQGSDDVILLLQGQHGQQSDSDRNLHALAPVGVTGTANNCVSAVGEIWWDGTSYSIDTGTRGC